MRTITRSSHAHNRRTNHPFSIAAATAAAGLLVTTNVYTGPAECSEDSAGMGCGKICAGILGAGVLSIAYSYYSTRAYIKDVIQKSPMTEEEMEELREFFLKTVTARYQAKGLNPSAEQLEKDAKSDEFVIFVMRAVFADVAVDGFISKSAVFKSNLTAQEKRVADVFWRSMDIDDDEKISCQEFLITCMAQWGDNLPARLTATFRALDDNGDGAISKAEMECWVRWNLAQNAATVDKTSAGDDAFLLSHKETLNQLAKARDEYKASLTSQFGKNKLPILPEKYDGLLTKATADITQELFAKHDVNNDGALQLTEFLQIAQDELSLVVFSNVAVALLK